MQERNIIGAFTASVLPPFIEGWQGMPKNNKDMEWTEILNWVFGGTSLVGVVTTLIFWKKSKRAKEEDMEK